MIREPIWRQSMQRATYCSLIRLKMALMVSNHLFWRFLIGVKTSVIFRRDGPNHLSSILLEEKSALFQSNQPEVNGCQPCYPSYTSTDITFCVLYQCNSCRYKCNYRYDFAAILEDETYRKQYLIVIWLIRAYLLMRYKGNNLIVLSRHVSLLMR